MPPEDEYERITEALGPSPPPVVPKIVIAPPSIDFSPQLSVHMPRSPYFTYYALYRAGMAVQDFLKAAIQSTLIDKMKAELPGVANWPRSLCVAAKKLSYDELSTKVLEQIGVQYKFLLDAWKAGIGAGMGASYAAEAEQFMNPGQLLYSYSTLQYQASVVPRMRRHWMSEYTPTIPNTQMAYNLMLRGKISEAKFREYASYDGWPAESVDLLKTVWMSVPNEHSAFRLMMRGGIDAKAYSTYLTMNGWPEGWEDQIALLYQWLPTASQAFTLKSRGVISTEKMRELFRSQGFTKEWDRVLPELFKPIATLSQAARMYLRGATGPSGYAKRAMALGYNILEAAFLMSTFLSYPTPREAFYMHRRAIIDETSRNKIYQAQGYLESWWPLISTNFQHIPNPLNAFKMMMRGDMSRSDFDSYIYQNGWPDDFAAKFYGLYQTVPTSHEAFFMWMKGILTLAQRNTAYKAYGWDPTWWDRITKNYYYVPTVYDLFRLADYAELDEIWATSVLRRRAVSDPDAAKIIPALRIRPLRDEIARQVYIWIDRYKLGWCSADELEEALGNMVSEGYIQTTEKTLVTEEAELKYEDELLSERITILMWKFRMGAITEAYYLQALLALGIRLEKANLMVEEQTAMGYYGYY